MSLGNPGSSLVRILPNNVAVVGETHHVFWCAEQGLIHDRWMADLICRHLKPGDVVIEGGAHIGTLTRAMLDSGAMVFAFEPNMDALECLLHNCPELEWQDGVGGLEQSRAFMLALGDRKTRTEYHSSDNAGSGWCDHREGGQVSVIALDSQIFTPANVKLIKLDIEGWETKALLGAREMIGRCHPVLFLEVNVAALERVGSSEDELLSLIEQMGYQWKIVQPQCRRGDPQYDIEAIPKCQTI
jgi:FkbM family methyltransferase